MSETYEWGKTADGVWIRPGMTLWVNSSVIGFPPDIQVVSKIEEFGRKFLFARADHNGRVGAKCSSAWHCPRKAMLYALMMEDQF